MNNLRLLLLSNSRVWKRGYLEHAEGAFKDFLGDKVRNVLFVPYAGVTIGWDDYARMVAERFGAMGYHMSSLHGWSDPAAAVEAAEAIAVGGGNSFHLLKTLYDTNTLDAIRERAHAGAPYMGWSAGANVACPTIRTTNDMPIVEPPSFDALGLVPFQINPHYTDEVLPKHHGETRDERLAEFVTSNPGMPVVGLREGTMFRVEGETVRLLGELPARIFEKDKDPREVPPDASFDFLLGN